jgi:hypothetical protein
MTKDEWNEGRTATAYDLFNRSDVLTEIVDATGAVVAYVPEGHPAREQIIDYLLNAI